MSLIAAIFVIIIFQSIGWLLAVYFKKNHIADAFWGPGIALVSWVALLWNGFQSVALILVTLLTTVWAGRLAYTIYQRNKGKEEDRRYVELSKDWKNVLLESYLKVWLLQGGLMILLGMSALSLSGNYELGSLNLLLLGLVVWGAGFYFEVVGDRQLAVFKKNPDNKGKLLTTGLWKYTRHPNYFGEVTMWWGLWLIAAGSGWWWLAIISPITITILILKVSGVPMAESHYDQQDREDWKDYKRKTSIFFPLPPKS
jgi:steroid 5-alpha reductase family enzyme